MSAFDTLLKRLSEKNVKNDEIDKIVEIAKGLAGNDSTNNIAQEALKEVENKASAKRDNKEIIYHDESEKFIDSTKNILDKISQKGDKLDFAPELIACYTEILKQNPKAYKKCNSLVNKVADIQNDKNTNQEASNYYKTVSSLDASKIDKIIARVRSKVYKNKQGNVPQKDKSENGLQKNTTFYRHKIHTR